MPGGGLIVVALLAVGALVISKPPLESSRPAIAEPHLERREAAQDIDARLWQDPFGAVAKARERSKKSPNDEKDEVRHSEQRFAEELRAAGAARRGGARSWWRSCCSAGRMPTRRKPATYALRGARGTLGPRLRADRHRASRLLLSVQRGWPSIRPARDRAVRGLSSVIRIPHARPAKDAGS